MLTGDMTVTVGHKSVYLTDRDFCDSVASSPQPKLTDQHNPHVLHMDVGDKHFTNSTGDRYPELQLPLSLLMSLLPNELISPPWLNEITVIHLTANI